MLGCDTQNERLSELFATLRSKTPSVRLYPTEICFCCMEMHINKPQCHHRKGWVYIYIRAIDPRLAGEYVLHDSCHYCEGEMA